ncbi:MAG TPA: hypothetical protein VFV75_05945 [Candidatus Polarisedimenticolaceae bacterium]|nr:hypothetical protein [Candidatus Polarisedimenticolaceae bacterium]
MRVLAVLTLVFAACAAQPDPSISEGPSPAADALIDGAATPEEKKELMAVRDQVDAEKRAEGEALDAEIVRLERENAELRKRR